MVKFLFIVATAEIRDLVSETIQEHTNYYSSILEDKDDFGTEIVVQLNPEKLDIRKYNADIIVARGATAIKCKRLYPEILVVEIPFTAADVISSVLLLEKVNFQNDPVALLGFGAITYQAQIASKVCGVTVTPFNFYYPNISNEYIAKSLDHIASIGYRYIIGGMSACNIARMKNLVPAVIQCGRESIWLALTEAQYLARIRRIERERAAHFETMLAYSREGIISTDVHNKIIHINSSACRLLDVDNTSSENAPLEKVLPDPRFIAMLNDPEDYSDELFKVKKNEIVLDKRGISLGGEKIGNVITLQNIASIQDTEITIRSKLYQRGLSAKYSFFEIIGESPILKETIKIAQTFAKVPSNILITGNTGTGKELFAQSIHNYSHRKAKPFVAVNCAAIPENLIESEFFGYVGGAFTGATKEGKLGYFELAHQGTLFLDEISEISLNLQGRLLRVIQESEVMRIGHDKIIPVNVRIICATNQDLKSLVTQGRFREDLYYRLCVLQLCIPPLCHRGKDILLLAHHFIQRYAYAFLNHEITLSPEAQKMFLNYPWKGNIRELRNVCEQLAVLNETGVISAREVSSVLHLSMNATKRESSVSELSTSTNLLRERAQLEKDLILKALKQSNYNKTKAASLLGMNRSTLWKKLKEHNININAAFNISNLNNSDVY